MATAKKKKRSSKKSAEVPFAQKVFDAKKKKGTLYAASRKKKAVQTTEHALSPEYGGQATQVVAPKNSKLSDATLSGMFDTQKMKIEAPEGRSYDDPKIDAGLYPCKLIGARFGVSKNKPNNPHFTIIMKVQNDPKFAGVVLSRFYYFSKEETKRDYTLRVMDDFRYDLQLLGVNTQKINFEDLHQIAKALKTSGMQIQVTVKYSDNVKDDGTHWQNISIKGLLDPDEEYPDGEDNNDYEDDDEENEEEGGDEEEQEYEDEEDEDEEDYV